MLDEVSRELRYDEEGDMTGAISSVMEDLIGDAYRCEALRKVKLPVWRLKSGNAGAAFLP